MILKRKKINKIILFGGSIILLEVAKYLKNKKYIIEVFSSKRLLSEKINKLGNLSTNLTLNKIKFYSSNNINKSKELKQNITINTLGIGFGETWSFSKQTINKFNGYLLDYMGIPLPRYRGGAHFTWMILQNEKNNGACLQIINDKMVQGIFDSGDVVLRLSFKNKNTWEIKDYFLNHSINAIKLIEKFLKIINTRDIKSLKIDESKNYFLPRLNTKMNGWVNWYTWNTKEIIDFIRAFGNPYKGGSSFIGNKRVYLLNPRLKLKHKFHPFQNGLICNINSDSYDVITLNGIITLNIIFDKKNLKNIKVGEKIYTPFHILENASLSQANYNSNGLIKK